MTMEELIKENEMLRREIEELENELYPRITQAGREEEYYSDPYNWIGFHNEDMIELRRREQ